MTDALELSNPGHRVTDPSRLEVGKRKPEGMPDYPHPELDVDSARGMRKEVRTQSSKHTLEGDEEEHADGDDVEGDEPPVYEDLVDHHLGGERSEEGEELQDQRCDHDLGEGPTMACDVGEEPGEAEPALIWLRETRLREHDETPRPFLLELAPWHDRRR